MLKKRITKSTPGQGYSQWEDIFSSEPINNDHRKKMQTGIPLKWIPPLLGMALFLVLAAVGIPVRMVNRTANIDAVGKSSGTQLASVSVENLLSGSNDKTQSFQLYRYTFKGDDSLSRISFRFNVDPLTIMLANGIHNPSRIKEGTELLIPSEDGLFHKVGKGESFQEIQNKYGLSRKNLQSLVDTYQVLPEAGSRIFVSGAPLPEDKRKAYLSHCFLYPLDGSIITEFGKVVDSVTGIETNYTGIDIAAPKGTAVRASRDGEVLFSAVHPSLGTCVILGHNGGYSTLYGQLTSSRVVKGQMIKQGQVLGFLGNPVFGKADHLFFSLKKQGKVIDPLTVLY